MDRKLDRNKSLSKWDSNTLSKAFLNNEVNTELNNVYIKLNINILYKFNIILKCNIIK